MPFCVVNHVVCAVLLLMRVTLLSLNFSCVASIKGWRELYLCYDWFKDLCPLHEVKVGLRLLLRVEDTELNKVCEWLK